MKYKVSVFDSRVFDTKEEAESFCNKLKSEYNIKSNLTNVFEYDDVNTINVKQYSELMKMYENQTHH